MRCGQLVREKADAALEPRPELREETKDVVASDTMGGHGRPHPVDRDRTRFGPGRCGAAVRQRGRAGRRLNNHVPRS